MSSRPQVQEFLDKLDELQAIFVLSRRFAPFLDELFDFVQDITVLLEEVNTTIRTRSGHMERATEHLKSVSEATEVATSEILDHSDEVLKDLRSIEDQLSTVEEQFAEEAEADNQVLALLREELGEGHEELLDEVARIQGRKQDLRDEWAAQLQDTRDSLSPIRDRMNQIMMSLQVQDVTEQQLSSVNHLIETVRDRIDALLARLGTGQADRSDAPSGEPSRTAAFNMNAEYDRSGDQQRMADNVMAGKDGGTSTGGRGGGGTGGTASQSTASNGASSNGASANGASSDGGEAASQSDIDDMFDDGGGGSGGGDEGGEAASQEEIDELFQ
ncbi:putative phage infection (PIP) family protein YhgE [Salinibacter ruber]|nr:hypothetical protein [Salinibacter ruber]MBB4061753.1 putative phage infection (PIP) family protein YhgE [Salinibacter ruber]MBB4068399.1 putative phage infection (PIP) family protein YhgE [Salinibacter ruber]MCS3638681.1 putative phage infection (PIP) family protein YhgE [Salinibacter ruber]MCS3661633.1 putative phage infection (PIP) family protein YhgE [Salinibacter ruber]MCS3663868.1 putative phage infection (PIP) family protein YhgE [Salinibacter ruber]